MDSAWELDVSNRSEQVLSDSGIAVALPERPRLASLNISSSKTLLRQSTHIRQTVEEDVQEESKWLLSFCALYLSQES